MMHDDMFNSSCLVVYLPGQLGCHTDPAPEAGDGEGTARSAIRVEEDVGRRKERAREC